MFVFFFACFKFYCLNLYMDIDYYEKKTVKMMSYWVEFHIV